MALYPYRPYHYFWNTDNKQQIINILKDNKIFIKTLPLKKIQGDKSICRTAAQKSE